MCASAFAQRPTREVALDLRHRSSAHLRFVRGIEVMSTCATQVQVDLGLRGSSERAGVTSRRGLHDSRSARPDHRRPRGRRGGACSRLPASARRSSCSRPARPTGSRTSSSGRCRRPMCGRSGRAPASRSASSRETDEPEPKPPGPPSQGAKGFVQQATAAATQADLILSELQDSMMPVEGGDARAARRPERGARAAVAGPSQRGGVPADARALSQPAPGVSIAPPGS